MDARISAADLRKSLASSAPPLVIDVRDPALELAITRCWSTPW